MTKPFLCCVLLAACLSSLARADDFDAVATTEDSRSVDAVGSQGIILFIIGDGGGSDVVAFASHASDGPYVAQQFVSGITAGKGVVGFPEPSSDLQIYEQQPDGSLLEIGSFDDVQISSYSIAEYESANFSCVIQDPLCDAPIVALLFEDGGSTEVVIADGRTQETLETLVINRNGAGSVDIAGRDRIRSSGGGVLVERIFDVVVGFPDADGGGTVVARQLRDGATVEAFDMSPVSAKGQALGGYGRSVKFSGKSLCIGQSPLDPPVDPGFLGGGLNLAPQVFANLGLDQSAAFGKFPLGRRVDGSEGMCASSAPPTLLPGVGGKGDAEFEFGQVVICDEDCGKPTVISGDFTLPGLGRSVSLDGDSVVIGGGEPIVVDPPLGAPSMVGYDSGAFHVFRLDGSSKPALSLTSLNRTVGAEPLLPLASGSQVTVIETSAQKGAGGTQAELVRVDLDRLLPFVFGDGFEE